MQMLKKHAITKLWKSLILSTVFALSAFTINAQSYVSSDIAMERLEIKLSEYYNAVSTQNTPENVLNKKIARTFVSGIVQGVNTGRTMEGAINTAHNAALEEHSQYANKVNAMKDEMEALLSL